jgi:hypothetical protein
MMTGGCVFVWWFRNDLNRAIRLAPVAREHRYFSSVEGCR